MQFGTCDSDPDTSLSLKAQWAKGTKTCFVFRRYGKIVYMAKKIIYLQFYFLQHLINTGRSLVGEQGNKRGLTEQPFGAKSIPTEK